MEVITTEIGEVSSVKILTVEEKASGKSVM